MAKNIQFDVQAREGLKQGVDALANAVKVTLGPKWNKSAYKPSYYAIPNINRWALSQSHVCATWQSK